MAQQVTPGGAGPACGPRWHEADCLRAPARGTPRRCRVVSRSPPGHRRSRLPTTRGPRWHTRLGRRPQAHRL